jgi:hypothetical protein
VSVVLGAKESPVGKAPALMDQERGSNPPVAVTVALYAAFSGAVASVVVVIVGGGTTLMVTVANFCGKSTEVTMIFAVVAVVTAFGAV